jgi:hypothetical protein
MEHRTYIGPLVCDFFHPMVTTTPSIPRFVSLPADLDQRCAAMAPRIFSSSHSTAYHHLFVFFFPLLDQWRTRKTCHPTSSPRLTAPTPSPDGLPRCFIPTSRPLASSTADNSKNNNQHFKFLPIGNTRMRMVTTFRLWIRLSFLLFLEGQ